MAANEPSQEVAKYTAQITINPSDPWPYYHRGTEYLRLGFGRAALADFTHAIAIKGDVADYYSGRGWAHILCGYITDPLADFDQALALNPRSATAFEGRGKANLEVGRIDAALSDYTQAVALDPQNAVIRNALARALIRAGKYELAEKELSHCIQQDPASSKSWTDRAWVRLHFTHPGDWKTGLDDLQHALALPEPPAAAYLERGIIRFALQDWNGAVSDLDAFVRESRFSTGQIYPQIWLYLSMVFQKHNTGARERLSSFWERKKLNIQRHALTANAVRVWPIPVVRYYLGEISQDELLSVSCETVPGMEGARDIQKGEACFFLAEQLLIQGKQTDAVPLLHEALRLPESNIARLAAERQLATT